jgi:hypothetical protein
MNEKIDEIDLALRACLKRASGIVGEARIPLILRYLRMSGRQKPLTLRYRSGSGLTRQSRYPQFDEFFFD